MQDILFENANKVYQLGLSLPSADDEDSETISHVKSTPVVPAKQSALAVWDAFTRSHPAPDFVRLSWLDYTATPRMRMVPFRRFDRLVRSNSPLDTGIAKVCLGVLQNDHLVSGVPPTGEYRFHPDFSSLKAGPVEGHANIYGTFREEDGSAVALCPRTQLIRASKLAAEKGISYLVGFEIEFVLLRRRSEGDSSTGSRFERPSNDGHAWSTSRYNSDPAIPKLLRDIVRDLDNAGIEVEQVHNESAPGQFELVLPAKAPLEAVDALLHTRETIAQRATEAGYKFTLHPKPFPGSCGTASHVHLSLNTADGTGANDQSLYESFYAGVLGHMRAIAAFTYSHPSSYERVVDSAWAGGRWVTWGTQNRETPLRKIVGSHWELKCMDGLANPYLALSAVLLAGLSGIDNKKELVWGDCPVDPAILTAVQKKELGIKDLLPADLGFALTSLQKDEELCALIGNDVVDRYIKVKKAEAEQYFSNMTDSQRREWVIERY